MTPPLAKSRIGVPPVDSRYNSSNREQPVLPRKVANIEIFEEPWKGETPIIQGWQVAGLKRGIRVPRVLCFWAWTPQCAAKIWLHLVCGRYGGGGVGHDQLKRFYKYHFIGVNPPDFRLVHILSGSLARKFHKRFGS